MKFPSIDATAMSTRQAAKFVLFTACAGCAALAMAHVSDEHAAGTFAEAWRVDAWVFASLLVAAVWYGVGLFRLWRSAYRGGGISQRRAACYASGLALLGLALAPPLDVLGGELFSAHMLQHEVIMLGAAPLLVAGHPLPVFLWAFPPRSRPRIGAVARTAAVRRTWTVLTRPSIAWMLHAVVLWAWHFPNLFQASLESEAVHALQHASFLASALLFWASLFGATSRAGQGTAVLSILTTAIHTGLLGALLTFSPHAWYPAYSGKTLAWGLTLLEDQQLGGLIMWVPAGFLFVFVGLSAAAKAIWQDRGRSA